MLTWEAVVGFGKTPPDVAESTWGGTPELVVHGKGFVRSLPEGDYLDGMAHHRGKNTGTGVVTLTQGNGRGRRWPVLSRFGLQGRRLH